MRQDVLETRDAIKGVVDSDRMLAGVCLSDQANGAEAAEQPTESMQEAALLLESALRQVSTVEGALKVSLFLSIQGFSHLTQAPILVIACTRHFEVKTCVIFY